MKYPKDFGYMSLIQTVSDVNNAFLSRRELTCDFAGLGGKLKTMEAVDMVTKEFKLDGKVVISMRLKTHVGMSKVTGTFYVYDDEALAKKHINSTIFSRLEKQKDCTKCPGFYSQKKKRPIFCKNPCEQWPGGIKYTRSNLDHTLKLQ